MKSGSEARSAYLKSARSGNKDALHRLLISCIPYIHFLVTRLKREKFQNVDLSDVTQETLFRAFRGFNGFHGNTVNQFLCWVRRILRNVVADHQLTIERLPEPLARTYESIDLRTASWRAEQAEHTTALEKALTDVGANYRQILLLRHGKNETWKVIGQHLHCSADAVRKIYVRAARKFAQLAKDLNPSA